MAPDLTPIERTNAAVVAYGAAITEAYKVATQSGGDVELAAVHMRRAGEHLVTLVEGLQALHEQLDRPPIMPAVGGYDDAEVLRIVRAAIAFRRAAGRRGPGTDLAPWSEMAELCAAVDRKPGPGGQGR